MDKYYEIGWRPYRYYVKGEERWGKKLLLMSNLEPAVLARQVAYTIYVQDNNISVGMVIYNKHDQEDYAELEGEEIIQLAEIIKSIPVKSAGKEKEEPTIEV